MGTLKITKKHHKHLNNPFPSTPRALPFIQGRLLFNSQTVPPNKIFSVGKDFQLLWSIKNGGSLSIYHQSQPTKALWSTIPGQAFVTAALCETEVEESRGSFAIKDRNAYLVCDHQTIEDIRVISEPDHHFDQDNDHDLSSGNMSFAQKNDLKDTQFPALVITGWLFSNRRKKRHQESGIYKDIQFETRGPPTCARYWVLFDQKNNNQIGFQVRVGPPNFEFHQRISPTPLGRHRRLRWKLGKIRRRKLGWYRFFTRSRGFVAVSSSSEEEMEMKSAELTEFNRVCITYSSEGNERFYGFGEQFSHMDFKGKRVPIFVQEQGIGRGDQPITFAANLVSYRAGGDWSTTYAPSPFYMTSKMRSLYLEGYDYSVFDMTRHDRVQIQIQSNSVQGRILNGNSPSEIIENLTETIGRPPELPKWIISGAVVGMQGGTEAVRRVWDELKDHKVPVSAFWLQVFPVPFIKYHRSEELLMRWMELNAFTTVFRTHEGNKPSCNSQFYSNHKTLSHFARCAKMYKAWYFYRIQLVKEAARKGLPVCRHLFLHYPNDRNVHSLSYQQFLIGTEILVVPVLDKGKKNVKAYFPEGETCSWQHIWSGKLFKEQGSEAWVEAPVGYPPVFIKAGSNVGETFVENLRNLGIL